MSVTLPEAEMQEAIASIQMYSEVNFDEPLGNLASGSLLDFFLQEVGPSIYNKAIRDVQERMQMRVMEVDVDMREPEFEYSRKQGWKRGR